jgi:hypothetical protein
MLDVVDHVMATQLDSDAILAAPTDDSRRRAYLWLFAHSEGSVFLSQAYSRFAKVEPEAALTRLYANRHPSPKSVSAAIRAIDPTVDPARFYERLRTVLPDAPLTDDLVTKLYAQSDPARWSLQDRGYLAKVHPLQLWLLAHLREHPGATLAQGARREPRRAPRLLSLAVPVGPPRRAEPPHPHVARARGVPAHPRAVAEHRLPVLVARAVARDRARHVRRPSDRTRRADGHHCE